MSDWAKEIAKQLGPIGLLLIGFGWLYLNPTQNAEFQTNTLARLAKVEADLDRERNKTLELTFEVSQLQLKLLTIRGAHTDLPWPAWLKDTSGVVLAANLAYELDFLKPRGYSLLDYVGQTDIAVWPEDIAKSFRENDLAVIQSGETLDFFEEVILGDGSRKTMRFVKYPVYAGGTMIGVAGMYVLPLDK